MQLSGKHTKAQWEELKASVGFRCVKCTQRDEYLTKDHIIPVVMGGCDCIKNLQPLCHSCNCGKRGDTRNWVKLRKIQGWRRVPEQDLQIPWPWSHYRRHAKELKDTEIRRKTLKSFAAYEREVALMLPSALEAVLRRDVSSRTLRKIASFIEPRPCALPEVAWSDKQALEMNEFQFRVEFILWELYHNSLISWELKASGKNIKVKAGKRKVLAYLLNTAKSSPKRAAEFLYHKSGVTANICNCVTTVGLASIKRTGN